ncbi:DNA polymerase subunit beta [Actinobacillus porcinus]|uniref:DNA polymerase subunit beta n=1 Tax=Actinobacillus porcinus TaxID=51048 RepID=A0ABY6TMZ5_9PAST|nr:nucleotidyltransferase domain-containing protein [Actinobacillus porcinus]VFY93717.1 DNA polymerase subunit beta [Actinobacillus porcinus]VTU09026.1 DNA polymerase subunit beta [Actinobacillus porcinus]
MTALLVTDNELAIVREILQKYVPTYEVWAFGSRVNGNVKPYSDLDLAVITAEPLDLQTHADLVDAFSESDLPWKVDIVDWATTSDNFRQIILQKYLVIQAN